MAVPTRQRLVGCGLPCFHPSTKPERFNRKNFASILGILLLTAAHAAAQSKATALTGAWRMTQLKTTGPNSRTVTNPQPSLYLFTAGHYSILSVNSDQPRPK